MKRKLRKSILGLGAGVILSSCGAQNASQLSEQKLIEPQMGEAYNQYKDDYLNQSCVEIKDENLKFVAPRVGKVFYQTNVGFSDLSEIMAGGGKLKLELDAVKANGEINFANKNKATNYSSTFVLAIDQQAGYLAIDQQNPPKLNANGNAAIGIVTEDPNDSTSTIVSPTDEEAKRQRCGTSFVSGKKLVANLVAVMKFEFANASDKDRFEGQMELGFDGVSGSAQIEKALEKVNENANISLSVKQMGGDATRLPMVLGSANELIKQREQEAKAEFEKARTDYEAAQKALAEATKAYNDASDADKEKFLAAKKAAEVAEENALDVYEEAREAYDAAKLATGYDIVDCSIKNKGACLGAWKNVLDYATTDFPIQFKKTGSEDLDPDKFVTIGYEYSPYTIAEEKWNGTVPTAEDLETIASVRTTFGNRFLEEKTNHQRAQILLDSGLIEDVNERGRIIGIQETINERMEIISDAVRPCYKVDKIESCRAAVNLGRDRLGEDAVKYNPSDLVIIPTDFMDWCQKLKGWYEIKVDQNQAIANTVLGPDSRHTLIEIINELHAIEKGNSKPKKLFVGLGALPSDPSVEYITPTQLQCDLVDEWANSVKEISLAGQFIRNIEPVASLKYLDILDLSGNYIEDTLPLSKLRFVSKVDLSSARIGNLKGINSSRISILNLSSNDLVADDLLWSLSGSNFIVDLNLSQNPYLDSIAGLKNMGRLKKLNVMGTELEREDVVRLFEGDKVTVYEKDENGDIKVDDNGQPITKVETVIPFPRLDKVEISADLCKSLDPDDGILVWQGKENQIFDDCLIEL